MASASGGRDRDPVNKHQPVIRKQKQRNRALLFLLYGSEKPSLKDQGTSPCGLQWELTSLHIANLSDQ